jgi:hypothetical protein
MSNGFVNSAVRISVMAVLVTRAAGENIPSTDL